MRHPLFIYINLFFILSLASFELFAEKQPIDSNKYKTAINNLMVGEAQVFRQNVGQWDSDILFQSSGEGAIASFYNNKVAFTLRKNLQFNGSEGFNPENATASFLTWNLLFAGSLNPTITTTSKLERNINYFGPSNPNGTKISEWNKLNYQEIYQNIDLNFYSSKSGALKYDYILKPGASVGDISMNYDGVEGLSISQSGQLILQTAWGVFSEDKPYSYQVINGLEREVEVNFVVKNGSVGFEIVGDYDKNVDLIIDPIYLDWSTFFYGEKAPGSTYQWTWILDIDIDDEDYVYITGMTSEAYPGTTGAYDTSITGYYDAFICKIKPNGDSIEYFSYLGGSSYDYGMNLTVNSLRQPVISGLTWGGNFPTTKDAFDTVGRSTTAYYYQGFVTKFSEKGDKLLFSTYLSSKSGTGYDWIRGMTLNDSGDVYLVGNTQSDQFPTTTGCFQSKYAGEDPSTVGGFYYTRGDAFLTCLRHDGKSLKFSTYIGGSKNESAYDLYLDENNEIYVVGTTSSGNFPLTAGAGVFNSYVKGTYDGFVMKFKANGNQLVFSKIMGGTGEDAFEGIYSNKKGEPFIAGYSNSGNFPTTSKAYQKSNNGGYDFVIVKMISSGTNVRWSTYLGGSGNEYYYSSPFFSTIKITANVKEEAIISGISQSQDYPVTSDALQKTNKSTYYYKQNLTITKLSYGGDRIMYATYFGGSTWEWPGSVKTKRVGCVSYILSAGITQSADYPVTKGVFKDTIRQNGTGWYSGFVTKFRDTLYTEPINLGFQDSLIECDEVFEILDGQNQGADFLWSDGWMDRVRIVRDTGTYWVRATYGCDTVRDTLTIALEYSPSVPVFGNDTTYCDVFPNLTLDAKNDTIYRSYLWNTGDKTQKININKEGKYYVDVSTPHCGTKSDTINFKLLKTPDVDLGKDQIACDSVRITLDAKNTLNEVKYRWNTMDSTKTIMAKDTGLYSVVVTNFCGADSSFVRLDQYIQPKAILPDDSVFCDNVFVILNGGQGENGEQYSWTSLDGTTEYSTATALILNQANSVRLRVYNKCGSSTDTMLISMLTTPKAGIKDTILACDVLSKSVQIGSSTNGETYLWNTGSTSPNFDITKPGTYTGMVQNKCGADSSTWFADLAFTPKVKLPNDSIYCNNLNVSLDAKDQVDANTTYQWQDGSTSSAFNVSSPGLFWVVLKNRCGTVSDSVKYELLNKPTVFLGDDKVFCGGVKSFTLTSGTSNNDETYTWSDGSVQNEIQVTNEGDYWLNISNYCGSASDTINVRVSPNPIVNLGPDTVLCGNFKLKLDAGNPGMQYSWTPYGETTQTIEVDEQRVYSVVVSNTDGCTGSDEFEVGSGCVSTVYIPTSFSPNGDGLNELFKPTLVNFEKYTLSIHDRWGNLLFESNDVEKGWDGTYMKEKVQAGVYMYSIRFITTEDGQFQNKSGLLHLVK